MVTVEEFHAQASAHFGKKQRLRYPPKLRRLGVEVLDAQEAAGMKVPQLRFGRHRRVLAWSRWGA